jgi:hypothetical protein
MRSFFFTTKTFRACVPAGVLAFGAFAPISSGAVVCKCPNGNTCLCFAYGGSCVCVVL